MCRYWGYCLYHVVPTRALGHDGMGLAFGCDIPEVHAFLGHCVYGSRNCFPSWNLQTDSRPLDIIISFHAVVLQSSSLTQLDLLNRSLHISLKP